MGDNAPPFSWFAPPEGVYTLVSSLNVPPNSATAHFVSHNPNAPPPPTPQLNTPVNGVPPPLPPPLQTTRTALVSVAFPVKEASGGGGGGMAGLGMSMGGLGRSGNKDKGAKDNSTTPSMSLSDLPPTSPLIASGALPENPIDALGLAGSSSTAASSTTNGGSYRPLMKKRAITSSFSIPTLGSLGGTGNSGTGGNGNADGTATNSRPVRQFRGTSSSFVKSWEGLPLSAAQMRGITEANAGKKALFGFYTTGKGVVWCELGQGRPKEAMARILFSAIPTCIDVNQYTASPTQIDVLVGFNSGDIFWFDPICSKYTRLNKSGIITSSPITSIQWLPRSHGGESTNLFLTSHADGSVLIWDKDREDWAGFTPSPLPSALALHSPRESNSSLDGGDGGSTSRGDSVGMRTNELVVSRPPAVDKKGAATTKFNPVSHWRVSKKAITAFAFSPDLQLCATVGEDGCLRIINAVEEKLLDTYAGYFGSLTCVSWSPDGRFVVTGGQDDLCTIYAPNEQQLVARCEGHSSWVTGVAWDPWRSDERTTRFASVGEDCKLILWDLSSAALMRPKSHAHHPSHRRQSLSSTRDSVFHLPLSPTLPFNLDREPVFHPSPRRDDVSLLQPVMMKTLSSDLFSSLFFLPDYIVTGTRSGQLRTFDRPPQKDIEGLMGRRHEFASSVVELDRRAR